MYCYWIYLLLFLNVSLEWNKSSALPRHASWHFEGEFGDYMLQLLTRLDQLVKEADEHRPGEVHTKEQVLFDHYTARYPACTWAPSTLIKRANEHRLKLNQRPPSHDEPPLPTQNQRAWTDHEVLLRNCYRRAQELLVNDHAPGRLKLLVYYSFGDF